MKVTINISDRLIEDLAIKTYPDLVRWVGCCSGQDCGCGGYPEAQAEKAVEEFEYNLENDKELLLEFLQEQDFTIE